nr:uncharacterized protein LOC128687460 [Cherax quadricarinatus]
MCEYLKENIPHKSSCSWERETERRKTCASSVSGRSSKSVCDVLDRSKAIFETLEKNKSIQEPSRPASSRNSGDRGVSSARFTRPVCLYLKMAREVVVPFSPAPDKRVERRCTSLESSTNTNPDSIKMVNGISAAIPASASGLKFKDEKQFVLSVATIDEQQGKSDFSADSTKVVASPGKPVLEKEKPKSHQDYTNPLLQIESRQKKLNSNTESPLRRDEDQTENQQVISTPSERYAQTGKRKEAAGRFSDSVNESSGEDKIGSTSPGCREDSNSTTTNPTCKFLSKTKREDINSNTTSPTCKFLSNTKSEDNNSNTAMNPTCKFLSNTKREDINSNTTNPTCKFLSNTKREDINSNTTSPTCKFLSNTKREDSNSNTAGPTNSNIAGPTCKFLSNTQREDTNSNTAGPTCKFLSNTNSIHSFHHSSRPTCKFVATPRGITGSNISTNNSTNTSPEVRFLANTNRDTGTSNSLSHKCQFLLNTHREDTNSKITSPTCKFLSNTKSEDNNSNTAMNPTCKFLSNTKREDSNSTTTNPTCKFLSKTMREDSNSTTTIPTCKFLSKTKREDSNSTTTIPTCKFLSNSKREDSNSNTAGPTNSNTAGPTCKFLSNTQREDTNSNTAGPTCKFLSNTNSNSSASTSSTPTCKFVATTRGITGSNISTNNSTNTSPEVRFLANTNRDTGAITSTGHKCHFLSKTTTPDQRSNFNNFTCQILTNNNGNTNIGDQTQSLLYDNTTSVWIPQERSDVSDKANTHTTPADTQDTQTYIPTASLVYQAHDKTISKFPMNPSDGRSSVGTKKLSLSSENKKNLLYRYEKVHPNISWTSTQFPRKNTTEESSSDNRFLASHIRQGAFLRQVTLDLKRISGHTKELETSELKAEVGAGKFVSRENEDEEVRNVKSVVWSAGVPGDWFTGSSSQHSFRTDGGSSSQHRSNTDEALQKTHDSESRRSLHNLTSSPVTLTQREDAENSTLNSSPRKSSQPAPFCKYLKSKDELPDMSTDMSCAYLAKHRGTQSTLGLSLENNIGFIRKQVTAPLGEKNKEQARGSYHGFELRLICLARGSCPPRLRVLDHSVRYVEKCRDVGALLSRVDKGPSASSRGKMDGLTFNKENESETLICNYGVMEDKVNVSCKENERLAPTTSSSHGNECKNTATTEAASMPSPQHSHVNYCKMDNSKPNSNELLKSVNENPRKSLNSNRNLFKNLTHNTLSIGLRGNSPKDLESQYFSLDNLPVCVKKYSNNRSLSACGSVVNGEKFLFKASPLSELPVINQHDIEDQHSSRVCTLSRSSTLSENSTMSRTSTMSGISTSTSQCLAQYEDDEEFSDSSGSEALEKYDRNLAVSISPVPDSFRANDLDLVPPPSSCQDAGDGALTFGDVQTGAVSQHDIEIFASSPTETPERRTDKLTNPLEKKRTSQICLINLRTPSLASNFPSKEFLSSNKINTSEFSAFVSKNLTASERQNPLHNKNNIRTSMNALKGDPRAQGYDRTQESLTNSETHLSTGQQEDTSISKSKSDHDSSAAHVTGSVPRELPKVQRSCTFLLKVQELLRNLPTSEPLPKLPTTEPQHNLPTSEPQHILPTSEPLT